LQKNVSTYDTQYIKEFEARVDAETASVKSQLKSAIENQDAESIMQAQEKLTSLAVQKERAKLTNAERALQTQKPERKINKRRSANS
jgi:intein-encoded DNA endonuclease-like protein